MSSALPPDNRMTSENWLVMVDPNWVRSGDQAPPTHVIVGAWPLDEDDQPGPFQPNPEFVPSGPGTPTDPIDAVLRRIGQGQQVVDQLIPAVQNTVVEIAVDENTHPLIAPAPDGVPCIAIATAPLHKAHIRAQLWYPLPGDNLIDIVPDGVDILLNPDGPASMRLATQALRDARNEPRAAPATPMTTSQPGQRIMRDGPNPLPRPGSPGSGPAQRPGPPRFGA